MGKSGIVTGLPVTILFNNLYLNDLDKMMGKKYLFYRRVGDDFSVIDSRINLSRALDDITNHLMEHRISPQFQKINVYKRNSKFTFLGYEFCDGLISIPDFSLRKIKQEVRRKFKYYPIGFHKKYTRLRYIIYDSGGILDLINQIVRQYPLVNNKEQIRKLSEYFFRRLTVYFYGFYSHKNQRKTLVETKGIEIPSLYKLYQNVKNGRETFENMKYKSSIMKKRYVRN
jgi:hypothetical protein